MMAHLHDVADRVALTVGGRNDEAPDPRERDLTSVGVVLDVRCASLADDVAGVSIRADVTELTRPIATFETTVRSGEKVEIDLPQTATRRFAADLRLPTGGLGVVAPHGGGDPSGPVAEFFLGKGIEKGTRQFVLVEVVYID